MAVEKMKIIIEENGDVLVDIDGLKNKSYSEIINILEKALGPAKRFEQKEKMTNIIITNEEEEKIKV